MAIIWGKVQQVDEYHYCSFLKSQVPQPTCCFHSGLGNMISFIITAPGLFISSLKDPQGIGIRLRLRGNSFSCFLLVENDQKIILGLG